MFGTNFGKTLLERVLVKGRQNGCLEKCFWNGFRKKIKMDRNFSENMSGTDLLVKHR